MSFTKDQCARINKHIDLINDYLSNEIQPSVHREIHFNLDGKSGIIGFSIDQDEAHIYRVSDYDSQIITYDLSAEPSCFKSVYERPQVGYDLLICWKKIKERLLVEIANQKEENIEIDKVIDSFVV